jgi:competence protein ComEA
MDDWKEAARARLRVKVGAVIVLALVGLGCAVLVATLGNSGTTEVASREGVATDAGSGAAGSGAAGSGAAAEATGGDPGDVDFDSGPAAESLFVHILGAVAKPGLYELRDGDRAVDAVAAAGGFAADADQAQLNLARFVTDGEQIVVPVIGQVPPPDAASVGSGAASGKVNINAADAAALETLPRVGPALAQRIIAWREANGRFSAIEDLMSVTGIGGKTFEGLRDLVTV